MNTLFYMVTAIARIFGPNSDWLIYLVFRDTFANRRVRSKADILAFLGSSLSTEYLRTEKTKIALW